MSVIIKACALFAVLFTGAASFFYDYTAEQTVEVRPIVRSFLPGKLRDKIAARDLTADRARLKAALLPTSIRKQIPLSPEVLLYPTSNENYLLSTIPGTWKEIAGGAFSRAYSGEILKLTYHPELQIFIENLIGNARASHVAAIAMDPLTGKVLAQASHSSYLGDALLHTGYPAASLFKVITSAAALEHSELEPNSEIYFRGGTYTLNRSNYDPHPIRDNRKLTFTGALAKSCNPVFSRIALNYLNAPILEHYVDKFKFNEPLPFDVALDASAAVIPEPDYELGRTAAGFGEITISPIHAVTFMSAVANKGRIPRPFFLEKLYSARGESLYTAEPGIIERGILPGTADTLFEMMEETVLSGTSKTAFMHRNQKIIPDVRLAGKTGTLTGTDPEGLTRWFVGAGPIDAPAIAVAIVVVNPGLRSSHPSALARQIFSFARSKNLLTRDSAP